MSIFNVFTLLGGLAFFLYGMNIMGDALERKAGSKLKSILANLTSNTFKGFLLGLVVTAVIQSSSATTVMVVGFVNSGIMTLRQSIGIILGANIGTSATSWILSLSGIEGDTFWIKLLKPSSFTPILAIIGIFLLMFNKKSDNKDIALIFLGFAILMFGMETMSGAVEPLAESEKFQQILLLFSNPVLGIIVGAIMTAVIQSSSASVGILQALSTKCNVTYSTAIPIIMGQNIGTCITAMLSSVGASKNAKRTACVHLLFNTLNSLILLAIYCISDAVLNFAFLDNDVSAFGIALLHSIFNIFGAILFLPLAGVLEKLACMIVKDTDDKDKVSLLDERLLSTPPVAVERCKNITFDMAEISMQSLKNSMDIIFKYDENTADNILKDEDVVDKYEDVLGSYLVKLGAMALSDSDSREVSKLLRIIGDLERISDHSVNILESAREIQNKNLSFSAPAQKELSVMINAVSDILDMTLEAFRNGDLKKAYDVEPLEQVVDNLQILLKKRHVSRLRKNECTIEMGFVLSDLLTNLERVSDHCSNIAVCMIEIAHESFDTHGYIQELKLNHDKEFDENVQKLSKKYMLESV